MGEGVVDLLLDIELHRDNGPPYGTGFPVEALPERVPAEIPLDRDSKALFDWLAKMEQKHLGSPASRQV